MSFASYYIVLDILLIRLMASLAVVLGTDTKSSSDAKEGLVQGEKLAEGKTKMIYSCTANADSGAAPVSASTATPTHHHLSEHSISNGIGSASTGSIEQLVLIVSKDRITAGLFSF